MAATARGVLQAFLNDPVGSIERMRGHDVRAVHAAMTLLAIGIVAMSIDYVVGGLTWPASLQPGGKRSWGPILTVGIEIVRFYGIAAALWLGANLVYRVPTRWGQALWLTVPYALARLGLELVEIGVIGFHALTGINTYAGMFFIGFCAMLLILVVCARGLLPGRDWLSSLPLAAVAFGLGSYVPFLVLPAAGLYGWQRRSE